MQKQEFKTFFNTLMLVFFVATLSAVPVAAESASFDFAGSTPEGSWQEREQTTTNHKGKQTVMVMRMSYLGDEERNGETYAWIESELTNFKVKKKGRKQQGDVVLYKVLMKKSILEGDLANAVGNFSGLATEVIMQSGDSEPMRIKGADGLMSGMTQSMGLKVSYENIKDGNEKVTVPAGEFNCDRYRGEGTTSAKVIFKTFTVESKATQWFSSEVPFGMVKMVSDDLVNGETQQTQTVLTGFGSSGATSKITGEPQDLPTVGNIFGG